MSKTHKMSNDINKYDKKTPREHVLLRPDTYIGDISIQKELMWVWDKNLFYSYTFGKVTRTIYVQPSFYAYIIRKQLQWNHI